MIRLLKKLIKIYRKYQCKKITYLIDIAELTKILKDKHVICKICGKCIDDIENIDTLQIKESNYFSICKTCKG